MFDQGSVPVNLDETGNGPQLRTDVPGPTGFTDPAGVGGGEVREMRHAGWVLVAVCGKGEEAVAAVGAALVNWGGLANSAYGRGR